MAWAEQNAVPSPTVTQTTQILDPFSYIAGFVDGEGYIGFYRSNNRVHINISIVNTNKEALEFIQKTLQLGKLEVRKKRPDRRQAYALVIKNKGDALTFLKALSPLLKVKRPQATEALVWLNLRSGKNHGSKILERRANGTILKAAHLDRYTDQEEAVIQKVIDLNRRPRYGMD